MATPANNGRKSIAIDGTGSFEAGKVLVISGEVHIGIKYSEPDSE